MASVPASHVYVRHLASFDGSDGVVRMPDPVPADGRTVPGGWWPPLMLDPHWIARHHREFDVFHIHFGFDALDPDTMGDIVHELSLRGKPLIYTVHDLRNPHHRDPDAHDHLLDVLVPAADRLLTLTAGAAAEIERRWNRAATVLPHPHVVERDRITRPRPYSTERVVGLHAKSIRANMDPLPVLEVAARTVAELRGVRLRVDLHDEVFQPDNHWYAPDVGRQLVEYGDRRNVEVRVHPYYSDDQLWDYLSSLTASILPYRFGSHSGWLEACQDLGTAVIAPSCGFYSDQHPCHDFGFDETSFAPETLAQAIRTAVTAAPRRATWPDRVRERRLLARRHREIYERALS
ncbi:glycosyltransferase family protein [Rhodococcus triatomae]|nr:hypothetical protein G419_04058 [Rhodococcus triatomae BKS 15-14]